MPECDDSRRATDRLCAEYGQLPGLSLTAEQATRLLGLDRVLVVAVLEELERGAFLVRSATGQFVRWDHALGAVMHALPAAMRAERERHLLAGCDAVASASRDGFGFGEAVSDGERRALKRVAVVLERPSTD